MNNLAAIFAPDDRRDLLRKVGGLLIATALLMIDIRKSSPALGNPWGDWGLFFLLLVTFVFLYGTGLLGRRNTAGLRAWESVYLVYGIVVAPFVCFQFVEAVNGSAGAPLNIFWVFLVTAGLAAAAAIVAGVRYGLLLASIALIVSWSALWDKILSNGLGAHLDLYRVLLLIIAALLVYAGLIVSSAEGPAEARVSPAEAVGPSLRLSEMVTGAAIAAVLAGSLSITRLVELANPFLSVAGPDSSFFWELVLLAVSLAAVGYGTRVAARGPAYVGGFGLLAFLLIAGLDLNSSPPHGKIVGWPLALLIIGALAFLASLRPGETRSGGFAGAESGASPSPPPANPPG